MKIQVERIVAYKIAYGTDVPKLLGEGWKLYGNPITKRDVVCQAMIKTHGWEDK